MTETNLSLSDGPAAKKTSSVLAWRGWQRLLAVLPVLVCLWLGVLWALPEAFR